MQIKLLMGFQATFVDDGALFLNTGKLIPFDLLIWAAGADPPDFIGHMGLPLDEYGFLKVTNTLQSIKRSNIFGAGDCVSVGDYDLPKVREIEKQLTYSKGWCVCCTRGTNSLQKCCKLFKEPIRCKASDGPLFTPKPFPKASQLGK